MNAEIARLSAALVFSNVLWGVLALVNIASLYQAWRQHRLFVDLGARVASYELHLAAMAVLIEQTTKKAP